MSDREQDSGLAVWIALRRAHEGGVANLAGQWLHFGHRVPGYVADALDGLTSAGLLTLGEVEPESCGVRRVTITDSGSARYVELCRIHNRRGHAAVSVPRRWALSPYDQRSHLLAKRGPDQIGIQVAVCGHLMPWSVDTSAQPTGRRCLTCEALVIGSGPGVQLPLTTAEPVNGPSPELVESLALQRAHGDGVTKLGADYLDHGV